MKIARLIQCPSDSYSFALRAIVRPVNLSWRSLRVSLLAAVILVSVTATFAWALGGLSQSPGSRGCISEAGVLHGKRGECKKGRALLQPQDVATSPDGKNVYAVAENSDAVSVFDRNRATGALTQKSGMAGCISEDGGGCENGTALKDASHVAVSPDGKTVYVTSLGAFAFGSSAVAVFDRNRATGVLTQKRGKAGCISASGTGGACQKGKELGAPQGVTVSPDGRSVYVASSHAVAVFARNRATGALTQKRSGVGRGVEDALDVAVSPDGRDVYVTGFGANAIAVFSRARASGALKRKPGAAGCISADGSGGACRSGVALSGPEEIAVSPDGRNVYATSFFSSAIAIFDRAPAGGALTQKPAPAGCVSADDTGGICQSGRALEEAEGLALSPDGAGVYVTSGSSSVAVFDRDLSTGALTQGTGKAGCVSQNRKQSGCKPARALGGPAGIAVSPDARNVYVASVTSNALAAFSR
jgi:DNA-binding beta-propeller fold protein YncE